MKIFCIGRNYAEHAKEMKSEVPTTPVVFMKPDTALLQNNQPFYYPQFTKELHYELEIVIRINRVGKNIAAKFAHRYYSELAIGIDLTARDLQLEHKKKGLPWEIAKSFDNSAPISQFYDIKEFGDINNLNFSLNLNNKVVQNGNTNDMIFNVDQLIEYISKFFTIKIGDLIFTGTPAGVGELQIGDKLEAFIENKSLLKCNIK